MRKKPVVLAILDGFGISFEKRGNPTAVAKLPNLRYISQHYPGTTLRASGIEVGLSWGEMGSSEVGHTNIGAGLVVYQNLERFNIAIKNDEFYDLSAWSRVVEHAQKNKSAIHIMGLLSNGGVHSHIDHLFAIIRSIKLLKFKGPVFIHVFTDGQDVAPQSAPKFLELLENELIKEKIGKIATICGRYYAMDRSENWDRIERAYRLLTEGVGDKFMNSAEVIASSYEKDIKDEYVEPAVITRPNGEPLGLVRGNDALIFFNFRADRARQLTRAFTDPNFNRFSRVALGNLEFVSLTQYGTGYPMESAFPPEHISTPLAKVLSQKGFTQLHIAEKEKYAHVTYFFNGGLEKEFTGEDRIIIPSKSVASYDTAPEMSAVEIADRVMTEIQRGNYDFIVVNFANGDVIGHTGNFEASVKALEVLDDCIGKLMKNVLDHSGKMIITADHGNVEELINLVSGEIDKEHSTNPVPFWIITPENLHERKSSKIIPAAPQGILADVAPTILELMGVDQPKEMSGTSLLGVLTECPLI
jgi:2,3-bisphosphoglycerate-independent phosphoglycerate mutase